MNEIHNELSDDELSLTEIIDFFTENWKKIITGSFIGGVLGVAYALITPAIYEATAYIQVGKVANIDVENPALLSEKIKLPMYLSQNTNAKCETSGKKLKKLNSKILNNTSIIKITHKAKSPDDAKHCLESVLLDIRKNQNEIAVPNLESKKNQLTNLKQKLESAEQITKLLSSKKPNFDFSDPKFSASTLLLATTLSKENEVIDLRTQISDLELALAEPQTKEAYLTTPIYSPDIRVEPKRTMIVLISTIVGGLIIIGFLIMRKTLRKVKVPKAV
jgi:LPS O-antigen subunit length determinant protein (WzzB/FepE family)